MTQYIDKSALVAEIENIRKHYIERDDFDNGWNFALDKVLSFIDTIEVKEVDLEKEYEEFVVDDPILNVFIQNDIMGMKVAKHFFELGLNASNPLTWEDIANINDIVDEIVKECDNNILYDTREYFCKEVLKRFKAQKGELL